MTEVSGSLKLVTGSPAAVSQVWLRAPNGRVQGSEYVTEAPDTIQVTGGAVSFDALPGAMVMTLVSHGAPMHTVKLLVPDKTTATLAECIEAAELATDGTRSALERLALEVQAELGQVPSLVSDALAQDSTIIDAVKQAAASIFYTGTGSPVGKVSAPVGSVYTDTAATNGAVRWAKASGTGNAGWGVEYGDTGWRDISGLLSPGWTADIFMIRRQGDMVYLRHRSLSPGVDAPLTIFTFPAGFAGTRETCTLSPRGSGNEATINNSRELQAAVSGWGSLGTYSTHTATIPTPGLSWPAALPGTPA